MALVKRTRTPLQTAPSQPARKAIRRAPRPTPSPAPADNAPPTPSAPAADVYKEDRAEANRARATIERYAKKVRNPLTAIRAKCVECSGGSFKEIECCTVKVCALHPFRMGINPFNKRTAARLERDTGDSDED